MTGKIADEMNKQKERKETEGDRRTGRETERMQTKQTEPECTLIKALRSKAIPQPY